MMDIILNPSPTNLLLFIQIHRTGSEFDPTPAWFLTRISIYSKSVRHKMY